MKQKVNLLTNAQCFHQSFQFQIYSCYRRRLNVCENKGKCNQLHWNVWLFNMHVRMKFFIFWMNLIFSNTLSPVKPPEWDLSKINSFMIYRLATSKQHRTSKAARYTIICCSCPIWMPFSQHPFLKETWAICLPCYLLTQAGNKPSAGSEHERLKWYTVWKLSIQLLMSKIRGCRGQSCHLSQEEVIRMLPPRVGRCPRFSFTQNRAPELAATSQTSFNRPKQCPTDCLIPTTLCIHWGLAVWAQNEGPAACVYTCGR